MKAYDEFAPHRTEPMTFRFAADGHRGAYTLRDRYCEDPLCPGFEMRITLTEEGAPEHAMSFEVDREHGQARWDKAAPFLDQAIANEFTQSRANLRLLERRRQIVRAWGLSIWDGPLRERESRCYVFQDFAYEREPFFLQFASEGKEWLAMDQYCVNQRCNCEEVILSFYRNETTKEPVEPVYDLCLEVPTAKAKPLHGRSAPTAAIELLDGMKMEIVGLGSELEARRRFLRAAARRRLREPVGSAGAAGGSMREPALVATRAAKAGRNEPCPCGSGRKFKKCCGGAA